MYEQVSQSRCVLTESEVSQMFMRSGRIISMPTSPSILVRKSLQTNVYGEAFSNFLYSYPVSNGTNKSISSQVSELKRPRSYTKSSKCLNRNCIAEIVKHNHC